MMNRDDNQNAAASSSAAASSTNPTPPQNPAAAAPSPTSSSPNDPDTDDTAFYPLINDGPSLREPPGADLAPKVEPMTLAEFRAQEGPTARAARLRALWSSLPKLPAVEGDQPTATQQMRLPGQGTLSTLSPERAARLRTLYQEELVRRCKAESPEAKLWGGADDLAPVEAPKDKGVSWKAFRKYLWDQERELWDMFHEFDRNEDGAIDAEEMGAALHRAGLDLRPATVRDLVRVLSGTPGGTTVAFGEFRDFLLMLPRRATPREIYKFYQVHQRYWDGRGAARVDKEGDLNPSFPKAPGSPEHSTAEGFLREHRPHDEDMDGMDDEEIIDDDEEDDMGTMSGNEAWRFLLAGGIAGGVSRSVTAPFDRLKVYLITSTTAPEAGNPSPWRAAHNLWGAMTRIYREGGGLRAFWVGNGLNVAKILPESAIKFVSYEQTKRFLAKHWDGVSDPADISSSSRFIAGGVGGITSQLSIYGLETLKTRIQSELGPSKGWRDVVRMVRVMYKEGGVRSYYRGLTLGLVGVFPYSAIDMGTYETLKTAYCRSMNTDEPPVYAVLSFGALSGSVGAATVYPINLLRTRLQASGSSGHPQHYTGFVDVLQQTLRNEGWRGLYKGLLPSILKVGPAVGVSWIVYEDAKRRLGV